MCFMIILSLVVRLHFNDIWERAEVVRHVCY